MKRAFFFILPLYLWAGYSAAPVDAAVIETIDAIVNGELILTGDVEVELRINLMRTNQNKSFSDISEEELNILRRKMLSMMIDRTLLSQYAREKLTKEWKDRIRNQATLETDRLMDQYRTRFSTPEDLAREQERIGMTWEEIRAVRYREIELRYLEEYIRLQLNRSKIESPTPQEIAAFQKEHPEAQPSGKILIAHIFLRVAPNASEEEEKAILERANSILLRARAGELFEALAYEYSEDTLTSKQGGQFPEPLEKGGYIEEFDPLFDMNEGDISEPIRSPQGYHIVKILSKDTIEDLIMRNKRVEERQKLLEELREKATIDIRQGASVTLP